MTPTIGTLQVSDDMESLARAGAQWLCDQATRSGPGSFVVALSGGSTPRPLYALLAEEPVRSRFPWDRTHWIFGDERFVPPGDSASNYGMVRDAFLSRVPIPAGNVHPVPTEGLTLDQAAQQYEATLKSLYGADELRADRPLLDVNFLGMGDDGHTASLIPGEPVLQEQHRWVAAVGHGRPEPRITLTFPALNSSRVVVFLVAGASKRPMLDRVLAGDSSVPAGRIRPAGELIWFVDRAAAGQWAG